MKYLLTILFFALLSCRAIHRKRVEGNGISKSETRQVSDFKKLAVDGDFDITIQPADSYQVVIEADENLVGLIRTELDGGRLRVREAEGFDLHSAKGVHVKIMVPTLVAISLGGSGTVRTLAKLENDSKMQVEIGGSGDAVLEVKSPKVVVQVGGSGSVQVNGVTRDLDISIGGSGKCLAEGLLSENCNISIGGSGTARVYSSVSLSGSIGGSGDIYYAGHPQNVRKSIGGSGSIQEIK